VKRVLGLFVLFAGLSWGAVDPALIRARDAQDRGALDKIAQTSKAAADGSPKDAAAQYNYALASSYEAEVSLELKDKASAKRFAGDGIRAAESAVSLDPGKAEYYRLLGTLYGQAIQDLLSGLSYGKKAQMALETAKQKDPKAAEVWVADGVGKYYLPDALGGGASPAIASFKHAIELDPKNAEAWLWLGMAQRKGKDNNEARKSFEKSLQLDPNRLWTKQVLERTPAQ
jgi:tetratricopeptide (TPR) repeat protein